MLPIYDPTGRLLGYVQDAPQTPQTTPPQPPAPTPTPAPAQAPARNPDGTFAPAPPTAPTFTADQVLAMFAAMQPQQAQGQANTAPVITPQQVPAPAAPAPAPAQAPPNLLGGQPLMGLPTGAQVSQAPTIGGQPTAADLQNMSPEQRMSIWKDPIKFNGVLN